MRRLSRFLVIPALLAPLALLTVVVATTASLTTAQETGVPPVTNIAVCNGINAGETVVSWDAVPSATYYRVGYVNMVKDYPRAKNSNTGEWIEAFVYVDVNALNIPVSNGRASYALNRLVSGDRHAFTVLTSNDFVDSGAGGSVSSEFFWPSNPRWRFLEIAGPDPNCAVAIPIAATPTPTLQPTPTPRPTLTPVPRPTATPTPRPTTRAFDIELTRCAQGRQFDTADEIIIRGNLQALRTVHNVTVYGSLNRSYLPDAGDFTPPILLNVGSDELGRMTTGERRSFDVSYIHNGFISPNASCHVVVIYRDRLANQRHEAVPMKQWKSPDE